MWTVLTQKLGQPGHFVPNFGFFQLKALQILQFSGQALEILQFSGRVNIVIFFSTFDVTNPKQVKAIIIMHEKLDLRNLIR